MMATSTMGDPYYLSRHASETERLNYQHRNYIDNFEYHLHPRIQTSLPTDAKIADIGTGTAIWLKELAAQLPATADLQGFDISTEQYPPADALPANVSLHVQDVKHPFPSELHGSFDAVHLRLLIAAMRGPEDWFTVARNCIQLLKPGGWIQWCESNFSELLPVPGGLRRDGVQAAIEEPIGTRTSKVVGPVLRKMQPMLQMGWSTLPSTFTDLGCVRVGQDVVATDRNVHSDGRERATLLGIGPVQNMYSMLCKTGAIPDDEAAQKLYLREIRDAIEADQKAGMYWRWTMHQTLGCKPMD